MPKKALAVRREKTVKNISARPFKGGASGKRHMGVRYGLKDEIVEADYFNRLETARDFTSDQAVELALHGAIPPNQLFLHGLKTFIEKCMRAFPGQTCGFIRDKVNSVYAQTYRD